jgi:Tfp pilus assembly protein PilO
MSKQDEFFAKAPKVGPEAYGSVESVYTKPLPMTKILLILAIALIVCFLGYLAYTKYQEREDRRAADEAKFREDYARAKKEVDKLYGR